MNKFLVLFIFFIQSNLSLSQNFRFLPIRPYEPLHFKDFNPDWYKTNFDETIVSDSSDGYNFFDLPFCLPDIIEKDVFYTIDYRGAKWDYLGGTYITKKNLSNGEILWQSKYGLIDVNRQEVAILSYINDDGNFEVIGLMMPEPYSKEQTGSTFRTIAPNFQMVFTKRIYEINNGALLYFNNPDYTDKNLERAQFDLFGTSNPIYRENQNKIRKFSSIYLDTIDYKVAYTSTLLATEDFKVLSRDTLPTVYTSIFFGDVHLNQYPTKLNEEEFLFVEKLYVDSQFRVFLRYTDKELNVKEEYLSDAINQEVNFLSLSKISDDGKKLLFRNNVNIFDPSGERRYDILITDRKGKILNQVKMDTKYENNYDIIEWNDDNSLRLIAATFTSDPFQYRLEVLKIDNKGNVEVIKKHESIDSLRSFNYPIIRKLPNNKYLLRLWEGTLYREPPFGNIIPDFRGKATSHMMVDGSYFDIKNNVEEWVEESKVYISPNIVTKDINLKFEKTFSGRIEISDINGNLIKVITVSQVNDEVVDGNNLSSGTYFINFIDKEKKNLRQTLKFVKL